TYIFFSADHGLSVGRHGLLGKQNMYDHSIRIPLMMVGPSIPANQEIGTDVYLQDIMATSLELADIEKPDYVDFNSFLNLAKGGDAEAYDAIYGAYVNYQRMIRKGGMKLIVYPNTNQVLLYNLEDDPKEINNLADNPAYANQVASLFRDLQLLQQQYADTLDLKPVYEQLQSQL
ncbi:MAG: sulfatase/phosphatase domain-containing protein, partial [Bacteroidota bacterium]